jgi:ribosome-binding protein aMBF1 (putative translation factor)
MMAIEKVLTNKVGITSAYHRIQAVEINFDLSQINVIIASYAASTYRDAEKSDIVAAETKLARATELEQKKQAWAASYVPKTFDDISTMILADVAAMNPPVSNADRPKVIAHLRDSYNQSIQKEVEQQGLSDDEYAESRNLYIPQILADRMAIPSKALSVQKCTIPLCTDIRTTLYEYLMKQFPDFEESTSV